MTLSDRLRAIREVKQLSQKDISQRTALTPSYVLRVENGDAFPAIEALEKWAEALAVPLWKLFYDGEEPPLLPNLPGRLSTDKIAKAALEKRARY
jgi:transcriptional regulator with XRE-family HTH domain